MTSTEFYQKNHSHRWDTSQASNTDPDADYWKAMVMAEAYRDSGHMPKFYFRHALGSAHWFIGGTIYYKETGETQC